MKNHFKTLVALLLAFVLVFAFVSCGEDDEKGGSGSTENGEGGESTIPEPDDFDYAEDYRIRFVYSYTAKVVNSNDRTEHKKEVKTVMSMYVPVDNNGLTDAQKAEIAAITYNGYSFDKWYSEWDTETQTGVEGQEFVIPEGKITADMTIYGDRGNLAGANATWDIAPLDADGNAILDATAEQLEAATELMVLINGEGAMFDFAYANEIDVPWYKHVNKVTKVKFADGITTVGANSFNGFTKLNTIDFGKGITSINSLAFNGCTSNKFRTLRTPDSLKVIGTNAFSNTKLKEVYLNEGLTTISDSAFHSSNGIRSIIVPTTLTTVGNAAFHPGAVGSTNNEHALSKVYYNSSTPGDFDKIEIAMDNSWFADRPTIYYYTEDEDIGNDTESDVSYWHFAEVDEVLTDIPVQYCYTIKYYLESGIQTPIVTFRIPVSESKVYEVPEDAEVGDSLDEVNEIDDNGVIVLKGVVDSELVRKQKEITWNGYHFDWEPDADGKSHGLKVGDEITDDKSITCRRGKILSNYGGVVWEIANSEGDEKGPKDMLTIKIDPTAEDRVREDVADMVANGLIVADENETVSQKAERIISEKLDTIYKIWDFQAPLDTQALWTGSTEGLKVITTLNIEEGVEYIGSLAFTGLISITNVTLPESLVSLDAAAFDGCTKLVAIYCEESDLTRYQTKTVTAGETTTVIPNLLKENSLDVALRNVRATVYAKAYAPTAASGHYWYKNGDNTVAWVFDEATGALAIGGDAEMMDFETPAEAPWYGAKDKVTSVSFASNITKLGGNVINGYSGVTEISLPIDLKRIPASSLAGTKLVSDTTAYPGGVLTIDTHLIKVDAARRNTELFEMAQGVVTVAEGAFAGCTNIKRVYVSQTVSYINNGAFADSDLAYVYVDGTEGAWGAMIEEENVEFASASVHFKSDTKPSATATGKFYYKSGNEYVLWGCDCIYGAWEITKDATCVADGEETRYCIYDSRHTDVRSIEQLDPSDPDSHVFTGENVKKINGTKESCTTAEKHADHCTVIGCDYYDEDTVEIKKRAWGHDVTWVYTDNGDGTVTATTEGVCTRSNCAAHTTPEPMTHEGLVWVKTADATDTAKEMGYFENQPVDEEEGTVYHGSEAEPIEKPEIKAAQ